MNKTLAELMPGETARVLRLHSAPAEAMRLSELGLIPGTAVKCVMCAPFGDPSAYIIRGAVIAIRDIDAQKISVTKSEVF